MLKVQRDEFSDADGVCLDISGSLIQYATEFRNEPKEETICFESAFRKIAAELAYPVLAVASVVEHIVRIVLCLICLIPSCCIDGGDTVITQLFYSITVIPDHVIRCCVGLFKNIFVARELNYQDLNLCVWKI
jgi:hypothetical protein